MLKSKISFQIVISVLVTALLQSCAINDNRQINKFFENNRSTLNSITKVPLTEHDIAAGLKEALKVGAERVVTQLGKKNGYLNDRAIHIPLPAKLQQVHDALKQVGLGRYTKELEVRMNRAAEIAATKSKELFWVAIKNMRWQDVQAIYNGKPNAATLYFKKKMTPSLIQMMRPVIEQSLATVGAVKEYKKVVRKYHEIPFVPRVKEDLAGYVMDKGINGLFYYLEKEEAAIRNDPVKRTTDLLKRVFGKQ